MLNHRTLTASLILLTASVAAAQDDARTVTDVAGASLDSRRATQETLDDWAAQRASLKQRWTHAEAQVDYLEERVALERERLRALTAAGDEFDRRLAESSRLEASLEDTLLAVIGRMETAVAGDLPFLAAERTQRLRTVRRELGDPAATPADKLRRVLEALLIETGYGGALELEQERITVDGLELTCDLLHVGRLALFWLTPDEARGGAWNRATGAWEELQGGDLESVRRAVHMATRRRAVGVQDLPLGRVGS